MKPQEIKVGNKTTLNVILEEETIGIDEVVAIGYGTAKKSTLTGQLHQFRGKTWQRIRLLMQHRLCKEE